MTVVFHLLSVSPSIAGDEVDIDLIKAVAPGPGVSQKDFRRLMRTAIDRQNLIVEVLDAQAHRVTPIFLIAWILDCLSVPGSHSKVTSRA